MSEKWDRRYLELACLIASWSKDPEKQVGCVLVDEQRRIVSTGYNGPPRDVEIPEPDARLPLTLHAELNALLVAPRVAVVAYIWPVGPCSQCMAALAQHGIQRVVTKRMPGAKWNEKLSMYIAEQKQIEIICYEKADLFALESSGGLGPEGC